MASYTSLRHIDWPIVWESMQNPPIVLVRILIDVTCMNSSTLVTLMARALFNSTIIRFRWFVTFSIAQLQKLPPIHTDVIILRISRRHVRCLSAPDCDMSFTEKIIIENQVQDKRVLSCTVYTPQTTSNGWIELRFSAKQTVLVWIGALMWFDLKGIVWLSQTNIGTHKKIATNRAMTLSTSTYVSSIIYKNYVFFSFLNLQNN